MIAFEPACRLPSRAAALSLLDIRQEAPHASCRTSRRKSSSHRPPMHPSADVLQGTLDLLILKAVSLEPMHGWGISQRIQQLSSGVLEVNQGSLYPALHRLVKRRWLDATWGTSENNRRARFYRLSALGKRQLIDETATWRRFSGAVDAVLSTT